MSPDLDPIVCKCYQQKAGGRKQGNSQFSFFQVSFIQFNVLTLSFRSPDQNSSGKAVQIK